MIQQCDDDEINNINEIEKLNNYISGTLVIWENFDLIEKASGNVFLHLNEIIEDVSNYLSLIFHRFLNDEKR